MSLESFLTFLKKKKKPESVEYGCPMVFFFYMSNVLVWGGMDAVGGKSRRCHQCCRSIPIRVSICKLKIVLSWALCFSFTCSFSSGGLLSLFCLFDWNWLQEEEDEFDKVAIGRENAGDRLFMGDVSDHGSYLNSHNVLTNSLHGTCTAKDPRANHLAAKIRLKEDEDEAEGQKYNSGGAQDSEVKGQHVETSEDCKQLRSILKRKDNNAVFKPQKRVRFDPSVGSVFEEQEKTMAVSLMEPAGSDDGTLEGQNASRLPDYLLNPSKYTRYSFDSTSEFDEESNAQAYMDFINLVNKSKPPESRLEPADTPVDLSKSVIFIPKKKTSDAKAVSDSGVLNQNMEEDRKQFLHRAGILVGIAAGEAQHEVSAMEEDESQTNAADGSAGFQKPGRRYRTKSRSDDDDS